jgi:hypothetical protein
MIRLTCTKCRQLMTIDDAFAGGVCRCQFCGTIQTVPTKAKAAAAGGAAVKAKSPTGPGGAKTLYQNEKASVGSGSSLEALADVVASSGLADAAIRSKQSGKGKADGKPADKPAAGPGNSDRSKLMLIVAGGVIAVLVIVIVAMVMMRGGGGSQQPGGGTGGGTTGGPTAGGTGTGTGTQANYPNFCGLKIEGDSIIYLIDNGQSARETITGLKSAAYRSVNSLPTGVRFKILFWNPDADSYPAIGMIEATADNARAAEKKLDEVTAGGRTEIGPSLTKAMKEQPAAIVLVTGKAADLGDDFTTVVMGIRGRNPTRIYTIAVNGDSPDNVLANLAQKTGGSFIGISNGDLTP